jgi:hypothetical protein
MAKPIYLQGVGTSENYFNLKNKEQPPNNGQDGGQAYQFWPRWVKITKMQKINLDPSLTILHGWPIQSLCKV